MQLHRSLVAGVAVASLLATSACVTNPNTGQQEASRTALGGAGGAVAGLLVGSLIGGRTARILGAGIGGVAGAAIGSTMDRQIRQLRETTQGTGVDVTPVDEGKAILVNLPDGITFATGSSTISPDFLATLDKVADSLREFPNSLVDVYGHTDTVGSAEFNQRLSEQRAQAVARELIDRGVNSGRVRWQGFGETQLRVQTGDQVNEPLNRRVEIKIVPVTQDDVSAAHSGH